jgi:hypothetical protein
VKRSSTGDERAYDVTPEVFTHWSSNERKTFDTQPDLAKARCPVLVTSHCAETGR